MLAALALAVVVLSQADASAEQETPASADAPRKDAVAEPRRALTPDASHDVAPSPAEEVPQPQPWLGPARVMASMGSGVALGTLGAGGFMLTPIGLDWLWFRGASGSVATGQGFAAQAVGSGLMLSLLAATAPMFVYRKTTAAQFGWGLIGALLGVVVTSLPIMLSVLTSYSSILIPLSLVVGLHLIALGGGLGYELSGGEARISRRSRPLTLFGSTIASTGMGFALGASLGLFGLPLQPGIAPGQIFAPTLVGAFASPLGFALGPLLIFDKKSGPAYLAASSAAAVTTATLFASWYALERIFTWYGAYGIGFHVLSAAIRLCTAFLPGLAAAFVYDAVARDDFSAPLSASRTPSVDVLPSFGFDGKRAMLGVTVLLP